MSTTIAEKTAVTPALDEKALTFSLGDLIREGSRLSPCQMIGDFGDRTASCALGAMTIAAAELGIVKANL